MQIQTLIYFENLSAFNQTLVLSVLRRAKLVDPNLFHIYKQQSLDKINEESL
jgi:hypothetical protein